MSVNCKFKSAFTLSEVLITLVVIGVIAALTLPAVINKYQEKQTVAKLKKVYTTLGQIAMRLSYNEENAIPTNEVITASNSEAFVKNNVLKYFNGAIVPKKTFYKSESAWDLPMSIMTAYQLGRVMFKATDGIIYFMMFVTNKKDENNNDIRVFSKNISVYVDLNGVKEPNKVGKDVFIFVIDCEKGKVDAKYGALEIQKNGWRMPK